MPLAWSVVPLCQVVRVEVCLAAGKSCTIDTGGQQTVCRQKYAEHRWGGLKQVKMSLFCSDWLP